MAHLIVALLFWALLSMSGCKAEPGTEAKPAPNVKPKGAVVQLSSAALSAAELEFETVQPHPYRAT